MARNCFYHVDYVPDHLVFLLNILLLSKSRTPEPPGLTVWLVQTKISTEPNLDHPLVVNTQHVVKWLELPYLLVQQMEALECPAHQVQTFIKWHIAHITEPDGYPPNVHSQVVGSGAHLAGCPVVEMRHGHQGLILVPEGHHVHVLRVLLRAA